MRQNHIPPNFDFSSDFGHFILKILEFKKGKYSEFFFENRDFWDGDVHSRILSREGGTRPPGGDAHVQMYMQQHNPTSLKRSTEKIGIRNVPLHL